VGSKDELDRLATERCALVSAFEFAKQAAVRATKDDLRGEFLDLILTVSPVHERALTRLPRDAGYSLHSDHIVVALAAEPQTE
jgi:hypothetical protein